MPQFRVRFKQGSGEGVEGRKLKIRKAMALKGWPLRGSWALRMVKATARQSERKAVSQESKACMRIPV